MAQQKYRAGKQRKSDFPIFEYIDMLMPQNLMARWAEMPRHIRWTIVSLVASLILLWVFLSLVVGGLNQWADSRGAFLYDSYYLPYSIEDRPLPVYRGPVTDEAQFLILPESIGNQYSLQIPPSDVELEVRRMAERDAFLAASLPAAETLTTLRESMSVPADDETTAAAETQEAAAEVEATPLAESEAQPTVDPVQLQVMALDNLLPTLTNLNTTLEGSDSIDPVYSVVAQLQTQLTSLAATGITLPPEVEAFSQHLNALPVREAPIDYSNNVCLMAALSARWGNDNVDNPPCTITQRAMYVEQGDYLGSDGSKINIVAAEFPRGEDAAWAVKQLFYRARFIGFTGNFALDDIIEYNYFFSQINGVYSLAWSHGNWVFSISGVSSDKIEAVARTFPY